MAIDQDVQEEIYSSIKEHVKDELDYESLKKLKFLDAAAKETLRLYTTAPILMRECDQDTIVRGIHIPKVGKTGLVSEGLLSIFDFI